MPTKVDILQFIANQETATSIEIANYFKANPKSISAWLTHLKRQGLVEPYYPDTKRKIRWCLSDAGCRKLEYLKAKKPARLLVKEYAQRIAELEEEVARLKRELAKRDEMLTRFRLLKLVDIE